MPLDIILLLLVLILCEVLRGIMLFLNLFTSIEIYFMIWETVNFFVFIVITETVPDYSKMSLTQAKRYDMDS